MIEAPLAKDEAERLKALFEYHVLDTETEDAYDELTELAARIMDVPIALVSLIDETRQWFKSHHGLDADHTPRKVAFCSHAILQEDAFVVSDATKDERFVDNPLVTGEPRVIFYAGIPLKTNAGHNLGTLCAIDNKPRQVSEEQIASLKIVAKQVMTQLELRKNIRAKDELFEAQSKLIDRVNQQNDELADFSYQASHDLKAPILSIRGLADFIKLDLGNGNTDEAAKNAERIAKQTHNLEHLINDTLSLSKSGLLIAQEDKFDLSEMLDEVFERHQALADSSNVELSKHVSETIILACQKVRYEQILDNLVSNAIKYYDENKTKHHVNVSLSKDINELKIRVEDNGIGIPQDKQQEIFKAFRRLDPSKSFGSGLGLAILKKHLLHLDGKISVESSEEGSCFEVVIPLSN